MLDFSHCQQFSSNILVAQSLLLQIIPSNDLRELVNCLSRYFLQFGKYAFLLSYWRFNEDLSWVHIRLVQSAASLTHWMWTGYKPSLGDYFGWYSPPLLISAYYCFSRKLMLHPELVVAEDGCNWCEEIHGPSSSTDTVLCRWLALQKQASRF